MCRGLTYLKKYIPLFLTISPKILVILQQTKNIMRLYIYVTIICLLAACKPEGYINKVKYQDQKYCNTCETFAAEMAELSNNNNQRNQLIVSRYEHQAGKYHLEPGQFEIKRDTLIFRLNKDIDYGRYLDKKGTAIVVNATYTAVEGIKQLETYKQGWVGELVINQAYLAKNRNPFYYKIPLKNANLDGKQLFLSFSIIRFSPKNKKPPQAFCNSKNIQMGKISPACCTANAWEKTGLSPVIDFPEICATQESYNRYKSFTGTMDISFAERDFPIPDSLATNLIQSYIDKYAKLQYRVTRAYIKGYTSPIGPDSVNQKMARLHAEIVKQGLFLRNVENTDLAIAAEGFGEEWAKVSEMLPKSSFSLDQQIQIFEILKLSISNDGKEKMLKVMSLYPQLKDEILSATRHTFVVLQFEYAGKNQTLAEYANILPVMSEELVEIAKDSFSIRPYSVGLNIKNELNNINEMLTHKATPNLYAMRATYFLAQKEPEKAIEDLQRAKELDRGNPLYEEMIHGIEMQVLEEMSFEEQLEMLEKYAILLKENPDNEQIYLSNMALMDKVGYVSGALAEYQRIKEKNALHFNNQGVSHIKTYRLTEANEDFLNALRKDDKMAATYFNLAVLYAFRGYTNLVIYNLEKATTLDPAYKKRIFENPAFFIMANDPKFDKFR